MSRRPLAAAIVLLVLWGAIPASASERDHGRFHDDDGHPAEQALEWLADAGVVQGCNPPTNNRICPDFLVNRAEVAKMVVILGQRQGKIGPLPSTRLNRFIDDDRVWSGNAEPLIDLIASEGIVHGCDPPTNLHFCPYRNVSRAETAKIVVKLLDLSAPSNYDTPWTDTRGSWYHELARVAAYHGLWDSTGGLFRGGQTITRGEFATALVRAVDEDPCPDNPFTAERVSDLQSDYPGRRFTAYAYDLETGCAYWMNPQNRQETASVFKVMVMAGSLLEAQKANRAPTSWEWSRLDPMITESANQPVRDLWNHFGGFPWFNQLADTFGLNQTTIVGDRLQGPWGRTETSGRDQADLLRQVLLGEWGPLNTARQAEAWELMTSVVSSQTWGVTAGVPANWTVAQKNGFAGDITNSVGVVRGPDGDEYVVVILTTLWPRWEDGVPAVERISRWVADALIP